MRSTDVIQVMWRRKGIVALLVVLVIAAAAWSLSNAPDEYESRAKVALLPDPANPQLVPFYGQAVENLLPTYAEIVESQTFLDGIAERLSYETTGSELGGAVRAEPVSRIGVLDVVATSADPERAQEIARATADGLVERLADNGIVIVSLLDEPRVPTTTTAPSGKLVFAVAALVGLLAGCAAAVGWDRLFGRVSTVADVTDLSDLPLLSVLPEARGIGARRIVVGRPELHELEEGLRTLRTNILFGAADDSGGATIVTGLSPGDGKSLVAANLAILTAELGLSVLLVDADLHRPVQHKVFEVPNELGLTSIVEFGVPPDEVIVPTRFENLRLLPAGPMISSRAMEMRVYLETMEALGTMADMIIVDSPPLRAGDEVRLLAALSRRVVLLVRSGATSPREVEQAVESLHGLGGGVMGFVLTRTRGGADTPIKHYRTYRDTTGGLTLPPPRRARPDVGTVDPRPPQVPEPEPERAPERAPESTPVHETRFPQAVESQRVTEGPRVPVPSSTPADDAPSGIDRPRAEPPDPKAQAGPPSKPAPGSPPSARSLPRWEPPGRSASPRSGSSDEPTSSAPPRRTDGS